MLIEVLHDCFNDQLAQHLVSACAQRQAAVGASYYGSGQGPVGQGGETGAGGNGTGVGTGRPGAGSAGGNHLAGPGGPEQAGSQAERERDRERRVVS
jgi:hypothetical protein